MSATDPAAAAAAAAALPDSPSLVGGEWAGLSCAASAEGTGASPCAAAGGVCDTGTDGYDVLLAVWYAPPPNCIFCCVDESPPLPLKERADNLV